MSLESRLDTLNTLLANVITILQTGVSGQRELDLGAPTGTTSAPAVEPVEDKPKRGRPKKADDATSVYWHIPSLNSVFAQEPGMAAPTTPGSVQISKEDYDAKKAEIAARVDAALASQQANSQSAKTDAPAATQPTAPAAPAAAPAPSTTEASTTTQPAAASAASPATPTADVSFEQVVAVAKQINSSTAEGHGRQAVIDVLKMLMPNDPQPTIPKLQTSGVNMAAALKAFNDKLNPPAAAEPDLF